VQPRAAKPAGPKPATDSRGFGAHFGRLKVAPNCKLAAHTLEHTHHAPTSRSVWPRKAKGRSQLDGAQECGPKLKLHWGIKLARGQRFA